MIKLYIGHAHLDHEPRFPFPERGMDPYTQVVWTNALIDAFGRPDREVHLCTFSPYILGVINNGLLAFYAGEQVDTPPLDPAQLEVIYHVLRPPDEGESPKTGLNAAGLIDLEYIQGAARQIKDEFLFLKELVLTKHGEAEGTGPLDQGSGSRA